MKRLASVFLILMMVVVFGQTHATAFEWRLDPAHSDIMFEVKHIFSAVRGHFSEFSADAFFNPDELEKSRFDFVVKVDSIDTYIGKRDNHLRSEDFFAAKKYPEMVFKSSRVTHVEGNKYSLEGRMTVKDVSKNMKLDLILLGQKEHPLKKGTVVIGFETRFTLDRLEFNVGNGKFLKLGVVGKDVDVFISTEMMRSKAET